jgi:hypothetical protein
LIHESLNGKITPNFYYTHLYSLPKDYISMSDKLLAASSSFDQPVACVGDRGCGKTVFIHRVIETSGKGIYVDFERTPRTQKELVVQHTLAKTFRDEMQAITASAFGDFIKLSFKRKENFYRFILGMGLDVSTNQNNLFSLFLEEIKWNSGVRCSLDQVTLDKLSNDSDPYFLLVLIYMLAAAANKKYLVFDNLDIIPLESVYKLLIDQLEPVWQELCDQWNAYSVGSARSNMDSIRSIVVYRKNTWTILYARSDNSTAGERGRGKFIDDSIIDISSMNDRREIIKIRNQWLLDNDVHLFSDWKGVIDRAQLIVETHRSWRDLEWMCNENYRSLVTSLASIAARPEWGRGIREDDNDIIWRQGFSRLAISGLKQKGAVHSSSLIWPNSTIFSTRNDAKSALARLVLIILYNSLTGDDIQTLDQSGVPKGMSIQTLCDFF